jgi:hypothetical protein
MHTAGGSDDCVQAASGRVRIVKVVQYFEARNLLPYRVHSPHGDVQFQAHEKSTTVHRLMGLCEMGALHEFVKVYQKGLMHQCHVATFEFAYALTVSLNAVGPLRQQDLNMWRWCIAGRKVNGQDDVHSWIEQEDDDEAFDVMMTVDGSSFVYVRPRRRLYKEYGVANVESRSLYHFAEWMAARKDSPLFVRYPDISESLSQRKTSITVVRV